MENKHTKLYYTLLTIFLTAAVPTLAVASTLLIIQLTIPTMFAGILTLALAIYLGIFALNPTLKQYLELTKKQEHQT
jgi:hypothetical protein